MRPIKTYEDMTLAERMAHVVFSHGLDEPVDWSPEEHQVDHDDEFVALHHKHEAPICTYGPAPAEAS